MSDLVNHTTDATLAAIGSKATTAGGLAGLFAFFTSSQFVAFISIAVTVGGFWMNWYFKRRRDKRDAEEHEARMRAIEEGRYK